MQKGKTFFDFFSGEKKKVFGEDFWSRFGGFFLEGKIDIVWEEGAAQLYGRSSDFFPMK